jgi:hypothetical protein
MPTWLKWEEGRQHTGYEKMLLATGKWPLRFDLYLLRYHGGDYVPPHHDKYDGWNHYRLNIILRRPTSGGIFTCPRAFVNWRQRVAFFRPDEYEHSVSKCEGTRVVLSFGFLLGHDHRSKEF